MAFGREHSGWAPMLPVTVQFIVAMLAYALNQRMARKAEYLREENRVLKEALRAATRWQRFHQTARTTPRACTGRSPPMALAAPPRSSFHRNVMLC